MTTKAEALEYIRTLAVERIVTKDELDAAFAAGSGKSSPAMTKIGAAEIFYYVGAAIIFLGIVIFITQNWSALSNGTQILSTLGSGIAAYISGALLCRDPRTRIAGLAFHGIAAIVTPIGLHVTFDRAGFDTGAYGAQSLISGILVATYLLSYVLNRANVFALFAVVFGTWFFFSITDLIMGDNPMMEPLKFYEYRALAAGLTYLILGYAFSTSERAPLRGFLYGFGIIGLLGAALALGGWTPEQNIFWELVYPGLVFATLFLSIHVRSNAVLVWSTLFLMAYILKITSEYFSSGLGWPLALIFAGLGMMGAGYMAFSLRRKYLIA